MAEWHPTKNADLNPEELTHGSNKKVWWKCPKADDHEWPVEIYSRTKTNGSKCPFCAGKEPSSTYNLKLTHPKVIKDWHPTANGELKPEHVTKGSHDEVYWQCTKVSEHIYPMTVHNRVGGKKCGFCAGQRVHKTNSLATCYPEISKEWHPTKNGKKTPNDYTKSSTKIVWWKCDEGDDHEWDATIKNRTISKQGCAMCSGKRVCKDNSAALLYPHLKNEWHPTKNGDARLEDYTVKSNKIMWWQCFKGHEWEAPVSSRSNGHNCNICAPKTSRPEIRIFAEIRFLFSDSLWRTKMGGKELDVYVPSLKVGLEYDGYLHKGKEQVKKDLLKNKHFERIGIHLTRVRGDGNKPLKNDDIITNNEILKKEDIDQVLTKIKTLVGIGSHAKVDDYLNEINFQNDPLYFELTTNMAMPAAGETLAHNYPKVAAYWDYDKNYPTTPEHFTPFSKELVHWKCNQGEDHRWSALITNMKRERSGNEYCPFCNGRRASAGYNLSVTFPEVSKQWHPTANGDIRPEDVTQGSDAICFWLINGKTVSATIANKVAAFKRKQKRK